MAESVDALVSNTSGAIHPGSIPGLGTKSCKFFNLRLFPLQTPSPRWRNRQTRWSQTPVGQPIPVRSRVWVQRAASFLTCGSFCFIYPHLFSIRQWRMEEILFQLDAGPIAHACSRDYCWRLALVIDNHRLATNLLVHIIAQFTKCYITLGILQLLQ